MIRLSQSSPPRWVSPLVALTSNTPSPISSTEISNVPPPKIVDRDLLVLLLVQTVSERGRRRFVDDAQDFQAGDAAGIFGGLALRIVEIGRHGDDRLGDFLAQAHFGVGFQLGQNHRRNFRRAELLGLALHFDFHTRRRHCAPRTTL